LLRVLNGILSFTLYSSGLDPNSFASPIEAFDYMIDTWVEGLNKVEKNGGLVLFNGKDGPNLADLVSQCEL
jgi:hypothetical protein